MAATAPRGNHVPLLKKEDFPLYGIIVVYGDSKVGKSTLASTIAFKIRHICHKNYIQHESFPSGNSKASDDTSAAATANTTVTDPSQFYRPIFCVSKDARTIQEQKQDVYPLFDLECQSLLVLEDVIGKALTVSSNHSEKVGGPIIILDSFETLDKVILQPDINGQPQAPKKWEIISNIVKYWFSQAYHNKITFIITLNSIEGIDDASWNLVDAFFCCFPFKSEPTLQTSLTSSSSAPPFQRIPSSTPIPPSYNPPTYTPPSPSSVPEPIPFSMFGPQVNAQQLTLPPKDETLFASEKLNKIYELVFRTTFRSARMWITSIYEFYRMIPVKHSGSMVLVRERTGNEEEQERIEKKYVFVNNLNNLVFKNAV